MSGRVVLDNEPIQTYELYEGEMQTHSFQNSLQGIQDKSVLSKAFFSQRNIDCIQRSIQKKVLQFPTDFYIVL